MTAIPYTGTIPPDPTILPDAGQLQTAHRPDGLRDRRVAPRGRTRTPRSGTRRASTTWVAAEDRQPRRCATCCSATPRRPSAATARTSRCCSWSGTSPAPATRTTSAPSSAPPAPTDAAQDSRFVGGSQLVPLRLAKQLGDRVALNAAGAPDPADRDRRRRAHRPRHRPRQAGRRRLPAAVRPRHRLVPAAAAAPRAAPAADADGRADEVRRRLRDAVLAQGRPVRLRASTPSGAVRTSFDNSPPDGLGRRAAVVRRRLDLAQVRQHDARPSGARRCSRASPRSSGRRRCTRSSTSSTTGPTSGGPRAARSRSRCRARSTSYGRSDPRAVPPRALGRHRDLDVLGRLHGRRRPRRGARRRRGPGPAVSVRARPTRCARGRRWPALRCSPCSCRRRGGRGGRERWDTRVFAHVPSPGYPAFVYVHPNGRVYAGTYTNPRGDSSPSRVFEWTRGGTLQRSWTVPGQDLVRRARRPGRHQRRPRPARRCWRSRRSRVLRLNTQHRPLLDVLPLPDLPTCAPGRRARRRLLAERRRRPGDPELRGLGPARRALRHRLRPGRDLAGAARRRQGRAWFADAAARRHGVRHRRAAPGARATGRCCSPSSRRSTVRPRPRASCTGCRSATTAGPAG